MRISLYCAAAFLTGSLQGGDATAARPAPLPVARHIGKFGQLPGNCPTGGGNSLNDAPFIGNAGLGVVPCGAPLVSKARGPNHTVFYLASNEWGILLQSSSAFIVVRAQPVRSSPLTPASWVVLLRRFWSSNAHADTRPADIAAEPFAQARIGDVTLAAPALPPTT